MRTTRWLTRPRRHGNAGRALAAMGLASAAAIASMTTVATTPALATVAQPSTAPVPVLHWASS